MLLFLFGMAAGLVVLFVALSVCDAVDNKKARKARVRSVIHERINTVHQRIDRVGDVVKNLEQSIELLTARTENSLLYSDACVDHGLAAHELAFHAPKSPRKDKKK